MINATTPADRLGYIYQAVQDFHARHLEHGINWNEEKDELVRTVLGLDADPFAFELLAAAYQDLARR